MASICDNNMNSSIVNSSIENITQTTPLQEGMIFHYLLNPSSSSYVLQTVFDVQGSLDIKLVENALNLLIQRHSVLRTAFVCNKVSRPLQVVLKERTADFEFLGEMEEEKIKECCSEEVKKGFDLQQDPLLRVRCAKLNEDQYKLIITHHHVIMDGWCIGIFIGDFLRYYKELLSGKSMENMIATVKEEVGENTSFLDYINWLESTDSKAGYTYWSDLLDGCDNVTDVPDVNMATPDEMESNRIGIQIKTTIATGIADICAKYNVTSSTVFETAYGLFLQNANYSDDVLFGKVTSGRNIPIKNAESILGMFINTIPVRMSKNKGQKICDLLDSMQKQSEESLIYEHCSLAEIQANTSQKNDLIRTLFVYENYFVDRGRLDVELPFTLSTDCSREQTSYDFNFIAYQTADSYKIEAMYNPSRYTEAEVKKSLQSISDILEQMVTKPEIPINELALVSSEERTIVLKEFNSDDYKEFNTKSFYQLLEQHAEERKNKVALKYSDREVTYGEFKEYVDSLASVLGKNGVKAGDYVAIIAKRSVEMIVGIYATLGLGAIYVPIDPETPADRVQFILSDVKPKVILTYQSNIQAECPIIDLEKEYSSEKNSIIAPQKDENRIVSCIYTSGTTGIPKGVLNYEKGILNTLYWMKNHFSISADDVILQKTNYTFDVSETEILLFVVLGATLVIAEPEVEKEPDRIVKVIYDQKVTIINFVPSMLNGFLGTVKLHTELVSQLKSLKHVFVAGEALEKGIVDEFYKLMEKENLNAIMTNIYGPTEASIYSTYYECTPDSKTVLIGKPIDNCGAYIEADGQLCGINIPGELCISGLGVAKGYLNRDELTEQRFVKNPYAEGILYHTGDLARWLPDGTIEYLGRIDEQVKIRGYRIELGEIDSNLRKMEGVKNCAVIATKDGAGEQIICAYLVSDLELDIKAIKLNLSKVLPSYMIPSYITQIDSIPVNKNGKLDRRALFVPTDSKSSTYEAPRTELEKTICHLYEQILGIEQVGIYDDFFEMGGHSLRAIRFVNQLEVETGIRLKLRDVFEARTVANFVKKLESESDEKYDPIPFAEEKEYYPMSSAQKRIYLISQMDNQGILYNMAQGIKLAGEVSKERIENALNEIIRRHEILRTAFVLLDGEPMQKILDEINVEVDYLEDSNSSEEELLNQFIQPFDLSSGQLVRMKLVKQAKDYLLLFDMHHIITDGMSTGIFMKEFMALYNGEEISTEVRQYKDFSEWMRTQEISVQRNYWMNQFEGEIPVLDLPLDFARPSERSYRGSMVHATSGRELHDAIKALSRSTGTTEYMVLLSGLMVLLHKYSKQEDIIVGSPVHGRVHRDTEKMLGMFINTIALRGKPAKNKEFRTFLEEIKEVSIKAFENQIYPFEDLISNIDIKEDMSRNPLFDIMFILQNNEKTDFALNQSKVEGAVAESHVAKFDISLNVIESAGDYYFDLEYNTDIFKEDSIQWMISHYMNILRTITNNPEMLISEITEIGVDEKKVILNEYNKKIDFENTTTINNLLYEQMEQFPDNTALVYMDHEITYGELGRKAGILAKKLKDLGIQKEDKVALLTDRSIEMMIAVYGVLLSGAAYVPIDVTYPEKRIQFILEDCDAKVVITYCNEIETSLPCVKLENETWDGTALTKENVEPENLAYIIYTSGSTGKPKGVLVEHSGVANLANYFRSEMDITRNDRVLLFANYAFDGFIWETMMAMTSGVALVIPNDDMVKDPKLMKQYIEEKGVTISYFPPAFYEQSEIVLDKYIITAGSSASTGLVRRVVENCGYINSYGPTEVSVCATNWKCEKGALVPKTIPVGKVIPNKHVYIMEQDQLCGIYVPGEICISGIGIARGYLGEENLTKEKFVVDPYTGTRLYRTGDIGRWLSDGNIEFLGRADEQVKIRGFRIEIGEIENAIKEMDDVNECVAIVKTHENGEKDVYAYYTAARKISIEEVRKYIENILPEYMIPARMLQLDQIPMTRNGKVDKGVLPDISSTSEKEYIAPRNKVEKALCDCFADVLGISLVGINTNFFECGGDSIKSMRVVSKMRDLGYEIAIKDIMQGKTPERIAPEVRAVVVAGQDQRDVVGPVINTPMIREFFNWNLAKPWHFNQSIILPVDDDVERIKAALTELGKHHDMLRAVCRDGRLMIQSVRRSKFFDFTEVELEPSHDVEEKIDAECTKAQESIDLNEGPLMKAVFFRIGTDCYLLIAIHHLVVDTTSWGIISEDFRTAMDQLKKNEVVQLPSKTCSFKQWAKELEQYSEQISEGTEKEFWAKQNELLEDSKLLFGKQEGEGNTENVSVFIKKSDADRLKFNTSNAFGTQPIDLLIAAYALAAKRMSNQDTVSLNFEKHGRENIGKEIDITRTVGWFTCTYPLVLNCNSDLKSCIVGVKDAIRNVPNGGIGFGLLQERCQFAISDTYFNYVGDIDTDTDTSDSIYNRTGLNSALENKLPGNLNIMVHGHMGRLNIDFIYNQAMYEKEVMQEFSNLYKQCLLECIDFCENQTEKALTATDVLADIDSSDIDAINSLLL